MFCACVAPGPFSCSHQAIHIASLLCTACSSIVRARAKNPLRTKESLRYNINIIYTCTYAHHHGAHGMPHGPWHLPWHNHTMQRLCMMVPRTAYRRSGTCVAGSLSLRPYPICTTQSHDHDIRARRRATQHGAIGHHRQHRRIEGCQSKNIKKSPPHHFSNLAA